MCIDLLNEKWDVAIILDACRFDVFKKTYKKYFKGILKKKIGGSHTFEWLIRNFSHNKNYKDIIYISGNPLINSKTYIPSVRIFPKKIFYRVIDGWKYCWNEKINTTDPFKLVMFSLKIIKKKPKKKYIIHFIQPHLPFRKMPLKTLLKKVEMERETQLLVSRNLLNYILIKYHSLGVLYSLIARRIKSKKSLCVEFYKTIGIEKAKKFYEDNLHWVLKNVRILVKKINLYFPKKKVIITSDHGEAFGERNEYSHEFITNNPVIRIVPYLEVY